MNGLLVLLQCTVAGADFDQSFLHLEDDHPDHLRRIVGLVEHVVEVGCEDIEGTTENAHEGYSIEKRTGAVARSDSLRLGIAGGLASLRRGGAAAQGFDFLIEPRQPP